ncbi:MAG: DUF3368 domain-containing protein [Desulfotomaculales bacterium]
MLVVSDAGPLVTLGRTGYLGVLPGLFGRIIVPVAVYEEAVVKGEGRPGAVELENATWLEVRQVTNKTALALVAGHLDRGEAESIVLAQEINASLLLLDDLKARRFALAAGLRIAGTVAVLVAGVRKRLVADSPPVILQKLEGAGMHLSGAVAAYFLEAAAGK